MGRPCSSVITSSTTPDSIGRTSLRRPCTALTARVPALELRREPGPPAPRRAGSRRRRLAGIRWCPRRRTRGCRALPCGPDRGSPGPCGGLPQCPLLCEASPGRLFRGLCFDDRRGGLDVEGPAVVV